MSDRRYRGFGYHDQRRAADGIPPAAVIDLTSGYVVPIVVDLTGIAEDAAPAVPSWWTRWLTTIGSPARNASTGSPARNAPFSSFDPTDPSDRAASVSQTRFLFDSISVFPTGPSALSTLAGSPARNAPFSSLDPTDPSARAGSGRSSIGSISVFPTGPSALNAGAGSPARNAPLGFSACSASVEPTVSSTGSASVEPTASSAGSASLASTGPSDRASPTIVSDRNASVAATGFTAGSASVASIIFSERSASVDTTGPSARAAQNTLQDSDGGIEAYSCPICLDRPQQPVATMCGHIFCHACFQRYLCESKKCPLCKSEFKELNCIKLYI